MVKVRFVNESGEEVTLYQQNGSILGTLGAGKCWNRDPKKGTLSTVAVDSCHGQKFPPRRAGPRWIEKTEWTWEECPDDSIYAPYRSITFQDNNVVRLKRRPFWKLPDMKWPTVTFLFKSHKMKMQKEHLDKDMSSEPAVFYNGIPCRRTVNPLSKYAPYKKWIFDEVMVLRDSNPPKKEMIEAYENAEYGEDRRSGDELAKIEQITATERNERLSQVV